jgi:hypothetical protein
VAAPRGVAAPHGAPALRAVTALRAALPLLVAASLWTFDAGLVPLLPARLFHPPSPALEVLASGRPDGRMLAKPGVALAPEIPTFYGIADLGGYDALGPARVVRLRDAALAGRDGPDLPLLGLMAVRHLVTRAPPAGLVALPVPGPLAVAENPHALPRARLVPAASVEADDTRALQLLRRADFPRERSVVLAWGAGREAPADAVAGSARIVRDRPDEVVVAVEPAMPGWLVLADTWFPGWAARVDGTPREIVRANVAFRAVEVGPGERAVTFRYEPLSHRAGAIVSGASALAALALLAVGALSRLGAASGRRRPWLRPGSS